MEEWDNVKMGRTKKKVQTMANALNLPLRELPEKQEKCSKAQSSLR